MKGEARSLLQFMDGSDKRFIIPVYQRNYDWKISHCTQLYDDLVRIIKNDRESHFFGSIVSSLTRAGGANDLLIIDGQQRITTISLLLMAMLNAMRNHEIPITDTVLPRKIENKYLVDEYQTEERKVRLKPIKNDMAAFDNLLYKSKDDYVNDSNVTQNYLYFYNRILLQEVTIEQLYKAISKLTIIDIFLHKEDDPQLIFESLNSTGLGLQEGDKIRNFVLMGLEDQIQEKYYEEYWNKIEKNTAYDVSSFIRDYLTLASGRIPSIKEVYFKFKEYVEEKKVSIGEILESLLEYSLYYKKITSSCDENKNVNTILKRLNILDMSVTYPFLLAFFKYAREKELLEDEYIKVLTCVEVYIFRRLITGLPTNSLNKIFASLHKDILKLQNNNELYSEVMIYILQNKTGAGLFPDNESFKQSFITRNIYAMQPKNKQYLFDRLENGNSRERADVVGNMEEGVWTVEHIMPQTLSEDWRSKLGLEYERIHTDWLNTIANLTLTGYNSKYRNRPFVDKRDIKDGFKDSGLRINKFLSECEQWGEDELKQRQHQLWTQAKELWKYPYSSFKPVEKEPEIVGLGEDISFINRKILFFNFMGVEYRVIDWTDMVIALGKLLFELDPAILYKIVHDNKEMYVIGNKVDGFHPIGTGVFIKHSLNNNSKVRNIRKLFAAYELDESELGFGLVPANETE